MISHDLNLCTKSIHLVRMNSCKNSIAFTFNSTISSLSRCLGSGSVVYRAPHIFIIDVVFLCYCGLSTNGARVDV